jgi:hypothetical protein
MRMARSMTSVNCENAARVTTVARWLELIRAEYREMPCLSLTKPQMQRLWGLDRCICDALVEALVAAEVLRPSGTAYVAVTRGR